MTPEEKGLPINWYPVMMVADTHQLLPISVDVLALIFKYHLSIFSQILNLTGERV